MSKPEELKRLSEQTRETIRKHYAKVQSNKDFKGRKYNLGNPKHKLLLEQGCDLLQYNIVVRPFILRKYNIKEPKFLDLLLYLYPIQFFSTKDFKVLPMYQFSISFKNLIEEGYVHILVKKQVSSGHIYALTELAKDIVKDYYAYLSGEKVIVNNSLYNPFAGEDSTKADQMRMKVMEKLKHQSEKNPSHFRKGLYLREE